MEIRKIITVTEEIFREAGQEANEPLKKVSVAAVVKK